MRKISNLSFQRTGDKPRALLPFAELGRQKD